MIFLTDTLDIENLKDEKYRQPFYLTLKDLEQELWDDRGDMPNIDRVGQKSLGKTCGREIGKDIEPSLL
jgi:hypothetical protein